MATKTLLAVILGVVSLIFGGLYIMSMPNNYRIIVNKIQFFLIVETVVLIGSRYVWKRLVKPLDAEYFNSVVCKKVLKVSLVLFFAILQFTFVTEHLLIHTEPHIFSILSFVCLGLYVQVLICLLFVDVIHWIIKTSIRLWSLCDKTKNQNDLSRNTRYTRKLKVMLALLYAVLAGGYGIYNASFPPAVIRVSIPIKGLPTNLEGTRIVQISDLHIGVTVGKSKVDTIVGMVNDLHPDLVVIVGDLADSSVSKMRTVVQTLKDINSKMGKYFVTGNHEYITGDVEALFAELKSLGVIALHNSHVKLGITEHHSDEYLCLAGTDDIEAERFRYEGHGMDLDKALLGCNPNAPVLLLAHQPRAAKKAINSKYNIQLVLSGHTHGGQMMPMTILAYLVNPFYAGLYQYRGAYVYVSQGTVFWGIPMRHFSTSEITVITLRQP